MQIQFFNEPQPYERIYEQMRILTQERNNHTPDALWFLEHQAVFTQGQAGKREHILAHTDIPIVQSDRGGQVTYHGPGQLIVYALFNLKRRNLSVKNLTDILQESGILLLQEYGIEAHTQAHAPGVYVQDAKILSLGLRIRQGCSYHGMSLNVKMDLSPFEFINPCGIKQLKMTQISDFVPSITLTEVRDALSRILLAQFQEAS